MDWISLFENHGLPMLILGFLLWFIVKPIGDAYTNNINKQTQILSELVSKCNEGNKNQEKILSKIEKIEDHLKI